MKKIILAKEEKLAREDELHKWSTKGAWRATPDLSSLRKWSKEMTQSSSDFFSCSYPKIQFLQNELEYPSPITSIYPENNIVYCQYFPCENSKAAVLILGHWNSKRDTYNRLAKIYQIFGISALRMSLPYHDQRRPNAMPIATGLLSADINQTIEAIRQSTLDARIAIAWLHERGYKNIGIVGASLGTATALLVSSHDEKVKAMVCYLTAAEIADLIWQSSATQHLRESFEPDISIELLRELWSCINPANYLHQLARPNFSMHVGWAKYDTVCPPRLTQTMLARLRELGVPLSENTYRCGHNTLATTPFIQLSGYKGLAFMRAKLLYG